MTETAKHHTATIQKSIETGERAPLRHFDTRTYIQHNLALGDGFGALLEFLDSLPADSSRVRAVRTFEDEDISFAHLEYFLAPMGALVGFEVHRWSDGRIVEHWDNLQSIDEYPGDERPWITSGPTEAGDPARTSDSKAVVAAFVDEVLIGGSHAGARDHVAAAVADHAGDPADGVEEFLARTLEEARGYTTRHRLLGDGDFVLAMIEGTLDGAPAAFYELLRVEDGRIAERWEVVELIPNRSEWRNDNGKF